LAEELNLHENQIYKWFWDTKKKVEEDNLKLAKQISMTSKRQNSLNQQKRNESYG